MPLPFSGFTSSNKLFYILVGIIVFVFFATIIWILAGVQSRPEKSALEFWGVFDENKSLSKAIDKFESQHSGVRITYKEFSYEDYERNLIDALAAGTGPDIFILHSSQIETHANKIAPLPQQALGVSLVAYKNEASIRGGIGRPCPRFRLSARWLPMIQTTVSASTIS